jgi:hypothetical protein
MRVPSFRFLSASFAAAVVLVSAASFAQDKPADGDKKGVNKKRPASVINLDEMEVVGKVQKPHVFYVIERGDLKYKGLPLERSLLDEVDASVKKDPF